MSGLLFCTLAQEFYFAQIVVMSNQASPRTYILLGSFFCVIGFAIAAYGLGLIGLTFLHSNTDAPKWVFTAVGLFMFAGGTLSFANALKFPPLFVNIVGWSALALGWLMAHWLLLFAKGGKCSLGVLGVWIQSDTLCFGLASAVLALFDLIIFVSVIGNLWRRPK